MKTTVKHLLRDKGRTIKELTECLWNKGVVISYEVVKRYCRAWSREYGKPEIWDKIFECLREMEVAV